MELSALGKTALSTLLVLVAAWDFKTRRVPHWIAWPLLLIATAIRVWKDSWVLILFFLGLILVELLPQVWRGLASLCANIDWTTLLRNLG